MDAESKEGSNQQSSFSSSSIVGKVKANPWIAASIVLGVVLVVMIVRGGITGNAVSESKITYDLGAFLNAQGINEFKINSVTKQDSLYLVSLNVNSKDVQVYLTGDGKYLLNGGITPLAVTASSSNSGANAAPAEVPKSDKPVVNAYVFAYCPYGTQFEKAMAPIYNLLKSKAEINIVAIGAMHGEFEHVESLRQIAIEAIYGKDKLWAYLDKFLADTTIGNANGDEKIIAAEDAKIYAQLGIDKAKVDDYMAKSSEAIYTQQGALAQANGVSGSPTLTINGVQASVSRSPAAILDAVCKAFNVAPSECNTQVSTAQASAGFGGASSGSSSSSAASCGA